MKNIDHLSFYNLDTLHALKKNLRTSLVVQWLRLQLPVQGVGVQSLIQELRSHMPHMAKKTKHKTETIL